MLKNSLLLTLFCTIMSAESFDIFLQKALQNSPYLAVSALQSAQAKEEGALLQRYKNPTLNMGFAYFDPEVGNSEQGLRVSYTQPLRLLGVGKKQTNFTTTLKQSRQASHTLNKAAFIREISLLFSEYIKQKKRLDLGLQELTIANKIYEISQARYSAGTISRRNLLQSQVALKMSKIHKETSALALLQSYYQLLKLAGLDEEVSLDSTHQFKMVLAANATQNPKTLALKAEQKKLHSQEHLYENSIEWINLRAEYEQEPEENVAYVGVNIPLPLFSRKVEEQNLAKLKSKEHSLLLKSQENYQSLEQKRLHKERESLLQLQMQNKNILQNKHELLKMFEEGYKLENIKLLALLSVKNSLIQTQEQLII
jgi:outer membrane protein, heavy metal efflux system